MTNIELLALIDSHSFVGLSEALYEMNEVDIADILGTLPPQQAVVAFRLLKKDQAADVFAQADSDTQQHIIESISNAEIEELIDGLFVDDVVDMLEEMPANVVKRVLQNAKPESRALINRFLNYAPDSAGSITTSEFVGLKKDMTAKQAINSIRTGGMDKETVYVCYVTDSVRRLLGVVSFRELLFASPEEKVGDIMNTGVISVRTDTDREEVANLISRYGFLALPVVDAENRLVGIVTVDDAIDVIEQETTEDFHKMAAMLPSEREYLDTPMWELAKNRVVWLMVLMITSTLTGLVLRRFEAAIAAVPLLVTFVPMLMGTAGNSGSQASTMVIRGLAVGDLKTSDWRSVLSKELRVALLCGGGLAAINLIRVIIYPGGVLIGAAVSLSLFAAVIIAKACGSVLPLVAKKVGADPAVMAAPVLTTIVDVASLLIYFGVSGALLGI